MKGTVKWFSNDKGFGFICVPGSNDYFFYVSNIRGTELPKNGDSVTFEVMPGKKGRPAAVDVVIAERAPNKPIVPYYGKATYQVERTSGTRGVSAFGLGGIGAIIGGPVGGIVGAIIGAALGKGGEEREVEITSPCIRCGGTGQVTARVDGRIGFQCPRCKKYWTKRDEF